MLSYAEQSCCSAIYSDRKPAFRRRGMMMPASNMSSTRRGPQRRDGCRQEKRAVRITNGPSLGRKRPRRATTNEPGSPCRIAKATGAPHHFQMQFLQSCPTEIRGSCVGRSTMKKGRSEDERPKSREETPKWANGSLDRPAPPRYRDMGLFAVAINQPRGRRNVLPIICRRLATLIDPRPHAINMQGVDK